MEFAGLFAQAIERVPVCQQGQRGGESSLQSRSGAHLQAGAGISIVPLAWLRVGAI